MHQLGVLRSWMGYIVDMTAVMQILFRSQRQHQGTPVKPLTSDLLADALNVFGNSADRGNIHKRIREFARSADLSSTGNGDHLVLMEIISLVKSTSQVE